MESYQTWFGEGLELSVLRMLGLFDRPADEKALGAHPHRVEPAGPGADTSVPGGAPRDQHQAESNIDAHASRTPVLGGGRPVRPSLNAHRRWRRRPTALRLSPGACRLLRWAPPGLRKYGKWICRCGRRGRRAARLLVRVLDPCIDVNRRSRPLDVYTSSCITCPGPLAYCYLRRRERRRSRRLPREERTFSGVSLRATTAWTASTTDR